MPKEESGIDELMRLSRQFTRQKQENEEKEKQRIAQGKKVQGVLHGLQDLNISMALTQLKPVAKPDVIKRVSAMRTSPDAGDLRKLVTSLSEELEKQLGMEKGKESLANSMRTLNILLDLYFSLH